MILRYELTYKDFQGAWHAHWRRIEKKEFGAPGWVLGIILIAGAIGLLYAVPPKANFFGWTWESLLAMVGATWLMGTGGVCLFHQPVLRHKVVKEAWHEYLEDN